MNNNNQPNENLLIVPNGDNSQNNQSEEFKPSNNRGLKAVIQIEGFRRLWIGQIFSQLADKFYIVFMVYLIAQHWVNGSPQSNEALAGVAAAIRMDLATRAQMITLLATGIYVANSLPAMLLGTFAGVLTDRWPKKNIMVC